MIRLLQLPASLLGLMVVALVVTFSVAGLVVVRRRWPQAELKESNDLADPVYSMVGVLYAVLLAFMVVVVWEQFTAAEEQTQLEVGAIVDLLHEADAFPPETRTELRRNLVHYTADVVDREWPLMAKGEPIELESDAFRQLWAGYLKIHPQTSEETTFYNDSVNRLNELGSRRSSRIVSSEDELPTILWVLLIGGSVISVFFTYLFGADNRTVHILVVALLSAILGFVLFLIFSLEHPYSGSLSVKPTGFQHLLQTTADPPRQP